MQSRGRFEAVALLSAAACVLSHPGAFEELIGKEKGKRKIANINVRNGTWWICKSSFQTYLSPRKHVLFQISHYI